MACCGAGYDTLKDSLTRPRSGKSRLSVSQLADVVRANVSARVMSTQTEGRTLQEGTQTDLHTTYTIEVSALQFTVQS